MNPGDQQGGTQGRPARRLVLALWLLLCGPLGCWEEGDWHRSLVRGQADEAASGRAAMLLPPIAADAAAAEGGDTAAAARSERARKAVLASGGAYRLNTGPVVPPPPGERTISLVTALQMAGVLNPTIGLAREAVQESLAQELQADVLLVPTLHAGASFDLHRGNIEAARGIIEEVNRQSLYVGGGASAVGGGTVTVPGVSINTPLAEAFVEPHAARLRVTARQLDAVATRNNVLLDVATRYLALAGAQAGLQALLQSQGELAEVVRVTTDFAETGQGAPADMERARSETLLLHTTVERAEEDVAVASADLARLLDTDPSVRLRVADAVVPQVELVDPGLDLEQLVEMAVRNRPEVRARAADVAVNATELRKERLRPVLPALMLGLSAGEFGGGSDLADSRFGHTSGRVDFDLVATWSLQNLGIGNLAVQRQRRALVFEAEAERVRVIDQVRREVAEARALAAARRREVDLARKRVELAAEAYRQDLNRTRNLAGRPIVVLNSLRLLTAARQALVAALVRYDQAEFQLFVALGQPPTRASPDAGAPAAPEGG